MRTKTYLLASTSMVLAALLWARPSRAAEVQASVVRIAELEIDPAQLEQYTRALKEEIEASTRIEPGVIALYAVSVKNHPEQIRLLEMYASQTAYEAHLQTPHFRKYKTDTANMVRSLKLVETKPILLSSK